MVYLILTNNTFLTSCSQRLYIKYTLFSQVLKLTYEVFVVILYFGLILLVFLLFLKILDFFRCSILMLLFDIVLCWAYIFQWFELTAFFAFLLDSLIRILNHLFVLIHFYFIDQLIILAVIFLSNLFLLLKKFFFLFYLIFGMLLGFLFSLTTSTIFVDSLLLISVFKVIRTSLDSRAPLTTIMSLTALTSTSYSIVRHHVIVLISKLVFKGLNILFRVFLVSLSIMTAGLFYKISSAPPNLFWKKIIFSCNFV